VVKVNKVTADDIVSIPAAFDKIRCFCFEIVPAAAYLQRRDDRNGFGFADTFKV